jgi:hypothetical protein
MNPKWSKIVRNLTRFIDRRWYPDYVPNEAAVKTFALFQSKGRASLSEADRALIAPLIDAQANKELTIKMIVSEMAESWSEGHGWYPPLSDTIDHEIRTFSFHQDEIFVKALQQIRGKCLNNGFVNFLNSFTGFSREEKDRIIHKWIHKNA